MISLKKKLGLNSNCFLAREIFKHQYLELIKKSSTDNAIL